MILKVCGITNQEDADAAVEGGANAIGFNFYPRSSRYVEPERAASIATAAGVRRVGVFVNEPRERVEKLARQAALDVAQLHGVESDKDYPSGMAVWKSVNVTPDLDLSAFHGGAAEALLFDGPAGHLYGGAGKSFDWSKARGLAVRVILAGGLDATNVARAVELAHPWGVDACSRIESAPGKKDLRKMKEFLQAARAALLA
ncbi:MAG TPA: phosphoribosylanthranilate isomerase [Bryobacteraceae bacterium]|nr:phosphoribosylanthranilate isomerase [Bryobacteraceae bacterium]